MGGLHLKEEMNRPFNYTGFAHLIPKFTPGRSRPLHRWSQFGIKKPSVDLGLPARPAVYLLPNSRPLRKGESHPRAKEKKFCQSFCVILLLCTARSGDAKGLNKGIPTAEAR